MIRVRIIACFLSVVSLLACLGCAGSRPGLQGAAASWQDPDYANQPGSLATEQGVSDRVIAAAPAQTDPAFQLSENGLRPAQARPAPASAMVLVSLREWCLANGLPAPVPVLGPVPGFSIQNASGTLRLAAGSKIAHWKGMEIHLGYAPVLIQSQVYVQSADLKSTLAPLLNPAAPLALQRAVIVLDPGHGGMDSGTRSASGSNEKDFTLDWARRLQIALAADGWQVHLTRTSDLDVPLSNRVAIAESLGAGLFLSLHFNSAPPDKRGIETYCLTPAGVPSTLTRGFVDELELTLPNNDFDSQNLQFAALIHRALLDVNGGRDRGIRRARFPTVLRGQRRPAVLIEGGFMSNAADARLIGDPAHRQKLAEAIAGALRPLSPSMRR